VNHRYINGMWFERMSKTFSSLISHDAYGGGAFVWPVEQPGQGVSDYCWHFDLCNSAD